MFDFLAKLLCGAVLLALLAAGADIGLHATTGHDSHVLRLLAEQGISISITTATSPAEVSTAAEHDAPSRTTDRESELLPVCGVADGERTNTPRLYSSQGAQLEAFDRILQAAGLRNDIEILPGNVPNFSATMRRRRDGSWQRIIIYNPEWAREIGASPWRV